MSAKRIKGFNVNCPFCGQGPADSAAIRLDLNDLGQCTCSACDAEFTVDRAIAVAALALARWEAVRRWIDSAAAMAAVEPEPEPE